MKFNPNALAFWGFCGIVGYLIGEEHGALVGTAVGLGASVLATLLFS